MNESFAEMKTLRDYFEKAKESINREILRESEAQMIGADIEQLADFYIQDRELPVVETESEQTPSFEHQNYVRRVPAKERDFPYCNDGDKEFPCERVIVSVPIRDNPKIGIISRLQSATYLFDAANSNWNWKSNCINFCINTKGYGFNLEVDQIKAKMESGIEEIHEFLKRRNAEITRGNKELRSFTIETIKARKTAIENSKQKLAELTRKIAIPLKRTPEQGSTRIKLDTKPIVKRVKPNPQLPEEYILDESKLNDLLEVVDNQVRSYERTPHALVSLGEEDLRDLILANINSLFEGKATGETFSNHGKTDIYLNIDKGNILVFECKIWNGEKIFFETIDQLRGYLTWRHNFGVIIFFVRLKNFTKATESVESIISKSLSVRSGSVKRLEANHFTASHNLEDPDKEVKVHYFLYNLYCDTSKK